jgi:hypothetical protein
MLPRNEKDDSLGCTSIKIVPRHLNAAVTRGVDALLLKFCRTLTNDFRFSSIMVVLTLCNSGCLVAENPGQDSQPKTDAEAASNGVRNKVYLADRSVPESSGLANSLRRKGYFWTHNDSGDRPSLYAYDKKGRRTAKVKLKEVNANDWEDCCTFFSGGKARLLIADCGDNDRRRSKIHLLLIDEPDPLASVSLKKVSRITVRYPDGSRDCEAVAVDSVRKQIVLLTKSFLPQSGVYVIPLPDQTQGNFDMAVTAKKLTTLVLPLVTAADFDESTGDLWVTNYLQAFRFRAAEREVPLAQQLKQVPQAFDLPKWRQVEALTVDEDQNVWITSEGEPTPLANLVVVESDESDAISMDDASIENED